MRRLLLELLLLVLTVGAVQAAEPLRLSDQQRELEVWSALSVMDETEGALTLEQARARVERFAPPRTARNTLGQRRNAVWLRVPLLAAAETEGRWLLDIDYALLNRIDVYLLGPSGLVMQQARLGNRQAERPLPTRSHAVDLQLLPGQSHELWLRVETQGAMILPITLSKESAFLQRALREQMLQGLLGGLGLCLVCYSIAQWITLRERLLLKYALLIGSGVMFSVVQFGIGAQFLWASGSWAEVHGAGLAALLAVAGTFLFVEEALRDPRSWRGFAWLMRAGAALFMALALAFGLDLISLYTVSLFVGSVGLAPALLGLPGAIRRVRQGDSVGWYFIVAWLGYFVTTALMVKVIRGGMPANFWTLHSFQFGATLDMLLFLRVLALRLHAVHEMAARTAVERDRALSLAATDALTGLPNRRGLEEALARALAKGVGEEQRCAIFLIDLDGFKAVNDLHGHDAGDELLIAVGRRLREQLRAGDVVARLGGDEFVVLAPGLPSAAQAEQLGASLLRAFERDFEVQDQSLPLGATIGYAFAPHDGHDAATLLQRADAAMYAGKRSGKQRLSRAGRPH